MEEFTKKSLLRKLRMSVEELEEYYLELRKYEYDNNISLKGIELRKKIHPLLLKIIKIDRILSNEKITIINDLRKPTTSPIIYACTHIGGNDVQRAFEAIESHAYLFIGDLKGMYKDLLGLILYLNGAIILQNDDLNGRLSKDQIKNDKRIAKERAIELLKNGGDLLIYPEGAWNITPELLVMKIFNGTIYFASTVNATIIPMAIEQYENNFIINIGENIDFNSKSHLTFNEMSNYLRDSMAELKFNIIESNKLVSRETFPKEYKKIFEQDIISKCPYDFKKEDIEKTRYHDELSPDNVFSFQKKMIPNVNNAFLFKK